MGQKCGDGQKEKRWSRCSAISEVAHGFKKWYAWIYSLAGGGVNLLSIEARRRAVKFEERMMRSRNTVLIGIYKQVTEGEEEVC